MCVLTGNVLYEGYEHVMPNLLLPMGDRHDNFKLKVIVYAKDIFGATVEYLLTAKVCCVSARFAFVQMVCRQSHTQAHTHAHICIFNPLRCWHTQ